MVIVLCLAIVSHSETYWSTNSWGVLSLLLEDGVVVGSCQADVGQDLQSQSLALWSTAKHAQSAQRHHAVEDSAWYSSAHNSNIKRYAQSQPAAVQNLIRNWFCPEWCNQWVAAAHRFEHSDHDTNLAIQKIFWEVSEHPEALSLQGEPAISWSSLLMLLEYQRKATKTEKAHAEDDFISYELPGAVPVQSVVLQHILPKQLHLRIYIAHSASATLTASTQSTAG